MVTLEYLLQSPGEYMYPGFDKPVYFSPSFLASLAQNGSYHIEDEHNGPILTTAQKLFFKDNGLWMQVDDELKTQNKGFSTTIKDYEIVDRGERYEIIAGTLQKMALTQDPKDRRTILYNSNNPPGNDPGDGGNTMSEEVRVLEQKVGALKSQINAKITENQTLQTKYEDLKTEKEGLETQLTDKDNEITQLKQSKEAEAKTLAEELAGEDEDLLEVYKGMPKEQLLKLRQKSTSKLAKELAGEDEDLLKVYSKLSNSELETIKEKAGTQDTGYHGVGDAGGDDQNDGDDDEDGDGDENHESYEDYAKKRGGW